ncbi:MAG: hypothetical protein AAF790_09985 [Planctomycetota bacterium]
MGLVDKSLLAQSKDGVLEVPLKQPVSRRAEISFTARREIDPDDPRLTLRLPSPRATSQGPSELIVVVDPALRLTFDADRTRRLRPSPLRAADRDPADPAGVRTLRLRGFLPDQVFAATKRSRPGEVDVAIGARVELGETQAAVVQDFLFDAKFQPANAVRLELPAAVLGSDGLSVELLATGSAGPAGPNVVAGPDVVAGPGAVAGPGEDPAAGQPPSRQVAQMKGLPLTTRLTPPPTAQPGDRPSGKTSDGPGEKIAEEPTEKAGEEAREEARQRPGKSPAAPTAAERSEVWVDLPRPWLGPLLIRVRYTAQVGVAALRGGEPAPVPLATAPGAPVRSCRAVVSAVGGLRLGLATARAGWSPAAERAADAAASPAASENATAAVGDGGLLVYHDAGAAALPVRALPASTKPPAEAVVRFAWWQTWVTPQQTQQRAVFRVESPGSELRFDLPRDAGGRDIGEVEVLIDGEPVVGVQRVGSRLTAPLVQAPPGGFAGRPAAHTVEVRYFEPTADTTKTDWRPTRLRAEMSWVQSYWQVVLPRTRRVVSTPAGFVPAMRWSLSGGGWGRQPLLRAEELEERLQAVPRGNAAAADHAYLFSCYGAPPPAQPAAVATISGVTAVAACSAVPLVIGLAMIYLPVLRRPASLLLLSALAVAAGLLYPGPFLYLAQAGVAGVVLAGLAAALALVLQGQPVGAGRQPGAGGVGSEAAPVSPLLGGTDTMISLPMGVAPRDAGQAPSHAATASLAPRESNG